MQHYQDKQPNILVVGDMMIDHYLWGKSDRISPEAPVPVVDVESESEVLGGAGNVVNNLIALGARVFAATAIGSDEIGRRLTVMLKSLGVNTDGVVSEEFRKTTRKSRVIASNQQVIRFDSETRDDITTITEDKILKSIKNILPFMDIILLSDYGKGVLSDSLTQNIIKMVRDRDKMVLIDPKGKDYTKYKGATLVTPNKKEASEATGIEIDSIEALERVGFEIKNNFNLDMAIVTLSEEGMAIFDDTMRTIPTVAKEVYDVTGAGDTVLSTIGYILACGGDIDEAAKVANAAAAVVVGKLGSATANWDEIISYQEALHESTTEHRIKSFKELQKSVEFLKRDDKKIVFTNGCFDILHLGHVKYLQKAKSFGDVLIVGVNSDSSVKRLKGDSRPVNSEYDRAYILASLDCVDFVIIFDEDTPYNLISMVKPDVLVKGGDYKGKDVVGSDIAKRVELVDFVEGRSTTSTISRIKSCSL